MAPSDPTKTAAPESGPPAFIPPSSAAPPPGGPQAPRDLARAIPSAAEMVSRSGLFDRRIFWIMTVLLAAQLVLLCGNLWFQYHNYATGIALAREAGASSDSVSLILVYSRAWDFAVVKTSALFLGFLVFYSGALFVLRSAEAAYELSVTQGSQTGMTLKSSSPGLVMITLGAALVALVLYNKSAIELQVSTTPLAAATTTTSATTSAAASTTTATVKTARPAAPATSPGEDNRVPKLLEAD